MTSLVARSPFRLEASRDPRPLLLDVALSPPLELCLEPLSLGDSECLLESPECACCCQYSPTPASRMLEDMAMKALEGKLHLITIQRELSAVKCQQFLHTIESFTADNSSATNAACASAAGVDDGESSISPPPAKWARRRSASSRSAVGPPMTRPASPGSQSMRADASRAAAALWEDGDSDSESEPPPSLNRSFSTPASRCRRAARSGHCGSRLRKGTAAPSCSPSRRLSKARSASVFAQPQV